MEPTITNHATYIISIGLTDIGIGRGRGKQLEQLGPNSDSDYVNIFGEVVPFRGSNLNLIVKRHIFWLILIII